MTETERALHAYLAQRLAGLAQRGELGLDTPLLGRGKLDSLSIQELIAFCEERFGVSVPDDEVLPDNFESLRAIATLVERLRAR